MNITEIFISFNIQHFQKKSNLGNLKFCNKNWCFSWWDYLSCVYVKNYIERTKEKRKSSKLLGFIKDISTSNIKFNSKMAKTIVRAFWHRYFYIPNIFFQMSIMLDGLTIGSRIKRNLQPLPFTGFITETFRSDLAFASCSIPEEFLNYMYFGWWTMLRISFLVIMNFILLSILFER